MLKEGGRGGGGGGWWGAWTVCWFKGGLGKTEEGVDTPMLTMIILYYLELSRIEFPKLNSSILMEIVTIHLYPLNAGNIY